MSTTITSSMLMSPVTNQEIFTRQGGLSLLYFPQSR